MRERLWPALAAAALVTFGAAHWAHLEQPVMSLRALLLLAAVAALPAAAAVRGGRRAAIPAALAAAAAGVGLAARVWPWSATSHVYPRAVWAVVDHGVRTWFQAHTPFDPGRYPAVNADARLAFFALAGLLVWALVVRRSALPAIGLGFLLFALPSTDVNLAAGGVRAAMFLGLALAALAVADRGGRGAWVAGQTVALGVAAVIVGLLVGAAPGVKKGAFLSWQSWDPLAQPDKSVSVSYVWDQTYADLHWPKHRTVVMDVWSPKPLYWKAAILTNFDRDSWRLAQQPSFLPVARQTGGRVTIPPGDLPPDVSSSTADVVSVHVKILGLADTNLIAAGQPVEWTLPRGLAAIVEPDGTAQTSLDARRGAVYSAGVYAPSPTPAELQHSGTAYPPDVTSGITVGSRVIPPFDSGLRVPPALPLDYLRASDRVWRASGAAHANDPYTAAALVELYLRSAPFRYDLTPHLSRGGLPPLVQFLTRTHAGYCQMFSGAMALVLRLHGIPARIAVGFTTGAAPTTGGAPYVVTDRNAHAWVEVYFPGYGWLPFDPTPGRHLPESYSLSSALASKAFPSNGAQGTNTGFYPEVAKIRLAALPKNLPRGLSPVFHGRGSDLAGGGGVFTGEPLPASAGHHTSFLGWLVWAAAAILAAILALKVISVRWRYLRRGPRAQAAAAYHDLATYVADQGLAVGPAQTFEELADRVQDSFGVEATAFARAATTARYAPPRRARSAEIEMRRELRGVKRALRSRLSARERITGTVRLRSALAQGQRRE
jgi:hypothetical protein